MKILAGLLRPAFAACLVAVLFMTGGCADALVGAEDDPAPALHRPALPPPTAETTPIEVSGKILGRFGAITIPQPLTPPDSTYQPSPADGDKDS